jgi:hypothetical protein
VTNGVTPTMIHFHNNIPGQNGGVIYDLMGWYANGGIFGYWRDVDMTTPFDASISNKFRKDSAYINYHTAANPNGEIRGNSTRALCLPPTLSVKTVGSAQAEMNLYPNPAQNSANLDVTISGNETVNVYLTDITGRRVWNKEASLVTGINRLTIPLSGISPGVYFVNIGTTSGTISYKLIKE